MQISVNNKIMEIKYCTSFINRLFGLSFKKNIKQGLCFPKCNSIHMFFMFESIDIIMTDKSNKILYLFPNQKPWSIILPKKNVYYTYELPANTINKLNINDILNIVKK